MAVVDAIEYVTIRCRSCGGVAHPVTGCVYSPTSIVCGPCVRSFWAWLHPLMNGKPRRRKGQQPSRSFYDHAYSVAPKLVVEAAST